MYQLPKFIQMCINVHWQMSRLKISRNKIYKPALVPFYNYDRHKDKILFVTLRKKILNERRNSITIIYLHGLD